MTESGASVPNNEQGYPAYCCPFCHKRDPAWYLQRRGDAVVSWACDEHLTYVLDGLQRPREVTAVVVKRNPLPTDASPDSTTPVEENP